MRSLLLPLIVVVLAACRSAPPVSPDAPLPPPEPSLATAAASMAAGSAEGEARLAAAGEEAIPFVRPLLTSTDAEVRRRAIRLLLDTGEDMNLSAGDRMRLLLGEIAGEEVWPYSSLRALVAVRELREELEPLLRQAATGSDPEAEAARRLLVLWE